MLPPKALTAGALCFLLAAAWMTRPVHGQPTHMSSPEKVAFRPAEVRPPSIGDHLAKLDRTIALDLKRVGLEEALERIARLGGLRLVYDASALPPDHRVTLQDDGVTVMSALHEAAWGTGLQFKLSPSGYLLVAAANEGSGDPAPPELVRHEVAGTVTSAEAGTPIPGVNVVVKGTAVGTTTDSDGGYRLDAPSPNDTLVFSFVGFEPEEVLIAGRSEIDVTLREDIEALSEVIVVGYGAANVANLTGSVSAIEQEAIEEIPVTQPSQALAGQASGVSVRQTSGAPGQGGATIRIRGYGTFSRAGNEPLVIVDGIPSSLDNVHPNDIASISVLKDAASAAIYGSRAANGVILVETKKGRAGGLRVSYSAYVGRQGFSERPEFVDSWVYAMANNEASINMGGGPLYSEEDIEKFRSGTDPWYPNVDHYHEFFNSGNGLQTNHNLQFVGGSETIQYMASLGYLRQNGMVQENWYDRYNLRLNLDSDVTDRFRIGLNLAGSVSDENEPGAFTGNGTLERLVTRVTRQNATQHIVTPDGWYTNIDRGAPWAALHSENFVKEEGSHVLGKVDFTYDLLNSLEVIARGGYEFNNSQYRKFRSYFVVNPNLVEEPNRLGIDTDDDYTLTLEALLRYTKTLRSHDLNLLAGYAQTESRWEWTYAYRDNFPNNKLHQLAAASSENMQSNSDASQWALRSYFGRVRYGFDNRYLFEANARYDGSSRFRAGRRYGFFPSFSAGWRISNEEWFSRVPFFTTLKLRASWGALGNQQIGNYPYQSTYNMNQDYVFGNSVASGAAITQLASRDISWETTRIADVGIDASAFDGRMLLTVDYFNKKTSDILYPLTAADLLGMTPSVQNAGEVLNEGWEFDVSYNDRAGGVGYSISTNFSIVGTEVLSLANVDRDIGQALFIGQPLNAIYGYIDDGLFVDEDDISSYPTQPYTPVPGDIRYKDLSGPDGVPDGVVDAQYDRTVIGQTEPKYTYGALLSANFRNFDFSLQLQGAAGMHRAPEHYAARAFANGSNVQQWMWDNRWTPENPDRDAIYPRFLIHGEGRGEPYAWTSTYWFWDASYLRLKFAQIGYSLPSGLLNAMRLGRLRIYLSGRNLYTLDRFVPGWDPEMEVAAAQGGSHYPLARLFTLGVNVDF